MTRAPHEADQGAARALDGVFAALADPIRRTLLVHLVVHGPATATELAADDAVLAVAPISRQGLVKHLQALDHAGLVTGERAGREVRYRATPAPLAAVIGWLLDAGAQWDRRIDRLRGAVSSRAGTSPPA